jgi:hypothetical protein
MDDQLIKRLIQYVRCNECGEPYEDRNVRVLGRCGDAVFFSVECICCNRRDVIAALVREMKMPDLITDFTEEEFARVIEAGPVGSDDVVAIHNFLKDFDGDFSNLFLLEEG